MMSSLRYHSDEKYGNSKGRVKKKIVENSTKGKGSQRRPIFHEEKINNMGLKHWVLPKNHFKTHLFFQFLGGGGTFSAQILVRRVTQT